MKKKKMVVKLPETAHLSVNSKMEGFGKPIKKQKSGINEALLKKGVGVRN